MGFFKLNNMYYIYHIEGVKIGCTNNIQRRMKQQGYTEYTILETHTDIKIASERERSLQKEYGYRIDSGYSIIMKLDKSEGGKSSATKQWSENRDKLIERSKLGGNSTLKSKKGIFSLTQEDLSKQGKKGYSNGLGKLSKEDKLKISKKAGIVNRDKNSKLKPEDVLYIRKIFIPYHNEFGVVPLSKKYGVTEGTMRNAIKGKSFKDI
jgi:hypothetical protein